MKYMMLVYLDEQALSDSERQKCYVESAQLARDLNSTGNYLAAGPLHPPAAAETTPEAPLHNERPPGVERPAVRRATPERQRPRDRGAVRGVASREPIC